MMKINKLINQKISKLKLWNYNAISEMTYSLNRLNNILNTAEARISETSVQGKVKHPK